jgi:outer membrane protein assembly factor BamB
LFGAVALVASSCGGSSHQSSAPRGTSQPEARTWSLPNATLQNTRAINSSITSANVSKLGVAWRLPLKHAGVFGYYANTPVFGEDGTIYLQDLAYNVFAVNGKTGKTLWTHSSGRNGASLSSLPIGEGPNGVALVMRARTFATSAGLGASATWAPPQTTTGVMTKPERVT